MKTAALVAVALAGCQHTVKTPFPAGLEPFSDTNPVPEESSPYDETLVVQATAPDYIHVYARGYVLVAPADFWTSVLLPDPYLAKCSTDTQTVTADNDPAYEYSFVVDYTYTDVLTVEWQDQWRFGVVDGGDAAPALAMIKHQKVSGSSFITLSEGTIEVTATDDPGVTELSFIEHLDATSASAAQVIKNIQHNYDALKAVAHGQPIPACP
jgi:hypothetical protein